MATSRAKGSRRGVAAETEDRRGTADIEDPYRYRLTREVDPCGRGRIVFVMLNPSTADATTDDPTIRRCIGFAAAEGCAKLDVVNLFALRATDPNELRAHPDPIGPRNDAAILAATQGADRIVAAWGTKAQHWPERAAAVLAMLTTFGPVYALATTSGGHPHHPVRLPRTARLSLYRPKAAASAVRRQSR